MQLFRTTLAGTGSGDTQDYHSGRRLLAVGERHEEVALAAVVVDGRVRHRRPHPCLARQQARAKTGKRVVIRTPPQKKICYNQIQAWVRWGPGGQGI